MKRKVEISRDETAKKMKLSLRESDNEIDPMKLMFQQQTYFQEFQAKQQNQFQNMMMKMMNTHRAIHE